jgi:hypothetical protein
VVQEDLDGRHRTRRRAVKQDRPAVGQVVGERSPRGSSEQADPFLAALAHDTDLATSQVERSEIGRGQLADAQARGVRGLDDRAIAQREGDV